jgi:hypothetical protein
MFKINIKFDLYQQCTLKRCHMNQHDEKWVRQPEVATARGREGVRASRDRKWVQHLKAEGAG